MIAKLRELRDIITSICQVEEDKVFKGVYRTIDEDWLLIKKGVLESLLPVDQTFDMADTAHGKLIIERYLKRQAQNSIAECAIPISVIILTLKGYRKEETARLLEIPLEDVEDILILTEEFDEDTRAELVMAHSQNLYCEDVSDFLLCGGSYEKYRELLENRAKDILGY